MCRTPVCGQPYLVGRPFEEKLRSTEKQLVQLITQMFARELFPEDEESTRHAAEGFSALSVHHRGSWLVSDREVVRGRTSGGWKPEVRCPRGCVLW